MVSIKPVEAEDVTSYFKVLDNSLLYNDQQCTIKNIYGHFLDVNTNIYTNNDRKYWIEHDLHYALAASGGNERRSLFDREGDFGQYHEDLFD